jgi:predicted nucleic acid-binding protein
MILIDTSVWIEFFRGTGSAATVEARRLLAERDDEMAMCEPIAMEILSGATDDNTYAKLEQLANGLPSLIVDPATDFRAATAIYRAAWRTGRTIRSINDCLIAGLAIRRGAELVHREADFDVIAHITDLAATSLR